MRQRHSPFISLKSLARLALSQGPMTMRARYSPQEQHAIAEQVRRDGFCVLRSHFQVRTLLNWRDHFLPLLDAHIAREGELKNRGAARYYVTLPFVSPFADPAIYEDEDILAIVSDLVGEDAVMCQLATDTPLFGSEYQDIHRDAQPLFPELEHETPPFQLAINFPLCDVTRDNGPVEIAKGTNGVSKGAAMRRLENGESRLEPVFMKLGDVMIRDVRGLHRGTPNHTHSPRPMCVIGYSRKWLHRPEVAIQVPRVALETLSPRARHLLRFNPIVENATAATVQPEHYQQFAY